MHTHLTRVHLKGFRNIQDTETTFREGLNIIIGPNGCGKSNFLWLLANILKNDNEINNEDIKGTLKGFIRGWVTNIDISHKYTDKNDLIKVITQTNVSDEAIDIIRDSFIFLGFNIPNTISFFSNANDIIFTKTVVTRIKNNFDNDILKKFIKNQPIAMFKEGKDAIKYLTFSEEITKGLKNYTNIQDIKIKYPLSDNDIQINGHEIIVPDLFYQFKISEKWFRWQELSDGTRRIVWIVLNVLLSNNENIILIEEPELGIHPLQLNKLMEFIKKESKHKQIIISTHSPEVLNVLEPDELDRIKIAKYDEVRGTTVIHSIAAEEQMRIGKYMKETGFLSDFWLHLDLEGGTL